MKNNDCKVFLAPKLLTLFLYMLLDKRGFAKVKGPLFSLEASGKMGDAVVYFPWKGLHVVRQLITPTNPQSSDQGDIRLILGALGRACASVSGDCDYSNEIKTYMASGQTWVSAFIKYMIDNQTNDGDEWDTLYTEYSGHSAKSDFDDEAADLEIPALDIAYKGASNSAPAGMILYLLAKYSTVIHAANSARFNFAPYTTALASWTLTEIQAMVADFS